VSIRDYLVESSCDTLKRFCKDVAEAYASRDNELSSIRASVVLLCNTCPSTCAKVFHAKVTVPHGDRIATRDEAFFLTADNLVDKEEEIPGVVDVESVISSVRETWKHFESADKEKVWQYMQMLTRLTNKIYSA
jgi:hypothetical protein